VVNVIPNFSFFILKYLASRRVSLILSLSICAKYLKSSKVRAQKRICNKKIIVFHSYNIRVANTFLAHSDLYAASFDSIVDHSNFTLCCLNHWHLTHSDVNINNDMIYPACINMSKSRLFTYGQALRIKKGKLFTNPSRRSHSHNGRPNICSLLLNRNTLYVLRRSGCISPFSSSFECCILSLMFNQYIQTSSCKDTRWLSRFNNNRRK
jgi:hypothetical protein